MFFSRFAMQICATELGLWSKLQVCKPDASWYWLPQLCSVSLQPFIPFYPPPNKDPIQAPSILESSVSFLRIFLWSLVLSFESSFTSTVPNFELFKCAWVTECPNTFGDCERRWIRETVCPSNHQGLSFLIFCWSQKDWSCTTLHFTLLYITCMQGTCDWFGYDASMSLISTDFWPWIFYRLYTWAWVSLCRKKTVALRFHMFFKKIWICSVLQCSGGLSDRRYLSEWNLMLFPQFCKFKVIHSFRI